MKHQPIKFHVNTDTRDRLDALATRGITIRGLVRLAFEEIDCRCPAPTESFNGVWFSPCWYITL